MTEPSYSHTNGEHRNGFTSRYADGYGGYDSGAQPAANGANGAGYDPAATQLASPPTGPAGPVGSDVDATRAVSGLDGIEGIDLSKIGGTATYGSGSSSSSSSGAGGATASYRPSSYEPAGYNRTSYGASSTADPGGSTYRVGRDGSVKKLGVDTETGLPSATSAYGGSAPGGLSSPRPSSLSSSRGPRRASLQLTHIDPWSTMKFSLVMSVALFVVWMIAVGLLYGVLGGMGVFDQVNSLYDQVHGGALLTGGFVLGSAAVIGLINIVMFTALATVGSFVYNLCSDLVGGIEVTLSERE
ncbi:MAG TPA: DUF3566 domain-containing protein [Mycobacteriales bacterium]|nr:DUF3566 domain-containing protein [Mycobacteriales bacterium]